MRGGDCGTFVDRFGASDHGLSQVVIADLVAELGPVWQARREAESCDRPRRSLLRRGFLSNVAFADPDHLVRTVRRGSRKIQYRPQLVDGCLAASGLTIVPPWLPTSSLRQPP
ncbi:hypothetical protein GCM10020229_82420 [Kitasatospora albolonga]